MLSRKIEGVLFILSHKFAAQRLGNNRVKAPWVIWHANRLLEIRIYERADQDALPSGTVAMVKYRGRRWVGIKGDDGRWRDSRRRILAIERIIGTLFLLYNKEAQP